MKQRVFALDFAKVVTAFLVVFTHLYSADDSFRQWVYSYHMPLFFVISGMFHKELQLKEAVNLNFRRLIIPAFCFILFGFIVYACVYGIESVPSCLKQSAKGIILGNKIPANNVIWFLFALFWDNIFLNTILCARRYGVIFIILSFCFFVPLNIRFCHIGQALFSLPFYVMGYFLYNKTDYLKRLVPSNENLSIIKLVCMGGGFLTANYILHFYNLNVSMHLCEPGDAAIWLRYPLFYINGVLGAFGIMLLSLCVSPIPYVEKCSKGLISILGLQFSFMMLWDEYVGRNQSYILSAFATICIMLLCLWCHYIFDKYTPFIVGKK